MPKLVDEPLIRIQVRLYKRDKARLEKLFKGNIGLNEGIRKIIRLALNQADAEIARTASLLKQEEDLDDE